MRAEIPALAGLLSAGQVAETAASIAAAQEPDGAIPWAPGQHADVWNHVEAAMALLVGGQVEAAERAYEWCLATQRDDGSWPMRFVAGTVEDASGETNMSAYLAVGSWHHWLVRRDVAVLRRLWPAVRRGLDWVVGHQLTFGGIAWSQEYADGAPARVNAEALLAGSSSIYQSLRAGVALAQLMDEPQPEWELAGGRLGHALREHRDLFLDKSEFSMDWYYPVLGGAVRGEAGRELIDSRWDTFVEPGLGIRCVSTNPWVTGAETCELVLALDAVGDRDRALRLLADMQHLRAEDGGYWTGLVFPEDVNWPAEHTTYTAAAVVLAVDALSHTTPGSDIMRGITLAGHFGELALECGCASGDLSRDGVAGRAAGPA
jgi:hypothetical protein